MVWVACVSSAVDSILWFRAWDCFLAGLRMKNSSGTPSGVYIHSIWFRKWSLPWKPGSGGKMSRRACTVAQHSVGVLE